MTGPFARLAVVSSLMAGCLTACSADIRQDTGQRVPPLASVPSAPGQSGISLAIGPAGGDITLPSGAQISIPSGALAKDTVVTIESVDVERSTLGAIPVGSGIAAGPEGLVFAKPVEIRLPYDPKLVPAGVSDDEVGIRMAPHASGAFTSISSAVDSVAHVVVAQTTHFTDFVPAVPPPGGAPQLLVVTKTIPNGMVGTPYTTTLSAKGGTPPLSWSLSAGAPLPSGLSLGANGVLAGTPTMPGAAAFFVTVSDSGGQSVQGALGLTINAYSNPIPTLTTLTPSTIPPTTDAVTVTLSGSGFVPSSHVFFDAVETPTNYVNATTISTSLSPSLLTAGSHAVKVANGAPGGGSSTSKTFTVGSPNAVPEITSVSPAAIPANGVATVVDIAGKYFVNGSSAAIRDQGIATTFNSAHSLTAVIPASYVLQSGNITIFVYSPAPGGGFSATSATLTVGSPTALPVLDSLSKTKTLVGTSTFTLDVTGSNFDPAGAVAFGPTLLPTTVTDAGHATATIAASLVSTPTSVEVRFVNPAPSGASDGIRFVVEPPALPWQTIEAGTWGMCGLTQTKLLYCWGTDPTTVLPDIFPVPAGAGMTFDSISTSSSHVCGLKGGALYCWGASNDQGQAGVNSTVPTPLLAGTTFASVDAGRTQSCAITTAGALSCWGKGYGAPGDAKNALPGSFKEVSSSQDLVAALDTAGSIHCYGANSGACSGLSGSYTHVTAEWQMACGLTSAGQALCTGNSGQTCYLGHGAANPPIGTKVAVSLPAGVKLADVQAGCFASCGLATNGDVYCWGRNLTGILGDGTTSGVALAPVKVPGLPPAVKLAVGRGTEAACILSASGERWCWGSNYDGGAGIGYTSKAVPTATRGP